LFEFYAPLVSTRHIDPKYGLTYPTVDIKGTPNRDIVAWRRRIIRGILQDTPQVPFYGYDIYSYTQGTPKDGMLNERHSVDRSPSGISHRVAPEPVVNARSRSLGSDSPMNGLNCTPWYKWDIKEQAKLVQHATECVF
jgi:hypothetical protein